MLGCCFYEVIKWPSLLYYTIFNIGVWDWSISSILHLRFREHQGRGGKTFCKNWKTRKSVVRRRHLWMTEKATHMKSQQHGCLNKTRAIAMLVDIPMWMGEIPWDPMPGLMTAERESVFPRDEPSNWLSPMPGVSPKNLCTWAPVNWFSRLYL